MHSASRGRALNEGILPIARPVWPRRAQLPASYAGGMALATESPYERALGTRLAELHPKLREYFSTIPEGKVGIGTGAFVTFGTRHRWLAPVLAPLRQRGVLTAGLHRDVAFRVENRTVSGRAVAQRTMQLNTGPWVMRDAVRCARSGRVVDRLGHPETVAASFDLHVEQGALTMRSRAVGIKLGILRLRLPTLFAPHIVLRERFDDDRQLQRVELTIDVPVLGRVYEYAGWFRYRIEDET